MRIEQAFYGSQDVGGYRFLARSAGFAEAWLPVAERLCTGFGERPAGVACPMAVYAQPLDAKHVAVIQVADQGRDDAGRPGALAFRVLVLPRALYADLGGDPFHIAEAFPPAWEARGEVPTLTWTFGPPPRRTVEEIRHLLDVEADRTALLLGGAQVLVDGGRLLIHRNAPDPNLARQLWSLLPRATRTEIWPASFAFGNKHAFHLAIVPDTVTDEFARYIKEAEAGDYPEGRYESDLQRAAEGSDQAELDKLLTRPSLHQRFKLVIALLAFFALVPLILYLPIGPGPQDSPDIIPLAEKRPVDLPEEAELAAKDPQRRVLRDRINKLSWQLGLEQTLEQTDFALVGMLEKLDRRIDDRLGKTSPAREVSNLTTRSDPRSVLRALLWKLGVPDFAEPRLNSDELLDRLRDSLVGAKLIEKEER